MQPQTAVGAAARNGVTSQRDSQHLVARRTLPERCLTVPPQQQQLRAVAAAGNPFPVRGNRDAAQRAARQLRPRLAPVAGAEEMNMVVIAPRCEPAAV